MHPYLPEMIVRRHQADLRALAAGRGHARNAAHARQARQARARQGHRHPDPPPTRLGAGLAGLRLVYAAGEADPG